MIKWMKRLVASVLTVSLLWGSTGSAAAATADLDSAFRLLESVYEIVESYHKDGADLEAFIRGALEGGLEALGDPYTNFFFPEEFQAFLDSLEGTLTGIGIHLEEADGYVIVAAPIKGTPAYRAGLMAGDRILEANGVSLVGASAEKAGSIIRGEPGTEVTLVIERPSEGRTFTVTITREYINIPEVEYELLEDGVGYLALTGFSDSAPREFYAAVEALKEEGAAALVLDLRNNPGGYVDAAVEIASAWVPKGEPVLVEVGRRSEKVHRSKGTLIDLPTVVLVNNGSASAAEILAAAIQDYDAGVLVGTQTFGKGTVQTILFLSGGSGMKVTTAEYLTGKRRSVEGAGLKPDVVVEPPTVPPGVAEPLVLQRLLLPGHVGLDVLALQEKLAFLGYSTDRNGVLGKVTERAVYHFRWDHGLPSTSAVDSEFAAALNAAVADAVQAMRREDVQLQKAVELLKKR